MSTFRALLTYAGYGRIPCVPWDSALLLSLIHIFTGVVSFWTGLAGRGAIGVTVGAAFCLFSGLSGEAGETIWRSALTNGICSWWMEAAFTTGTEDRSATVPP